MARDTNPLARLLDAQVAVFPEHETFLRKRLDAADAAEAEFLDDVAEMVLRSTDGRLEDYCKGYRWLCETVFEEEMHFRRTGSYRLSTFKDALEQVYSDTELMTQYMRGLLMTQLWWSNHTKALQMYRDDFLAHNVDGYDHIEVGPGHGLLLHMALSDPRSGDVTGLDVSRASLDETTHALGLLGTKKVPHLLERDVFSDDPWPSHYDSLVIAEVLEHLETPKLALEKLLAAAKPGGRIFVHMPVNSPAPDHIYLARTSQDVLDLMTDAGWTIESHVSVPSTGMTLERAIRMDAALSVIAIGRAPG